MDYYDVGELHPMSEWTGLFGRLGEMGPLSVYSLIWILVFISPFLIQISFYFCLARLFLEKKPIVRTPFAPA
jgi:hypothetical protein